MSDRLVVRKTIAASREELFDAWLDPESMQQWMCPPGWVAEAQTDARVGGAYRLLMKGPGSVYDHTGEYKVIDRPNKLAFTWISEGTQGFDTLVTVEFLARDGATEVVLTHERLPESQVESHSRGWTELVGRLSELLESVRRR